MARLVAPLTRTRVSGVRAHVGDVVLVMFVMGIVEVCLAAIIISAICITTKRVVMRAAIMAITSVTVTIIMLTRATTVVAVFGRMANVAIGVSIVILSTNTASANLASAINVSATVARANVVNRKKKLGQKAAFRPTALSRRTTSPVDFSRRANIGSEPVAPAQKAVKKKRHHEAADERTVHQLSTSY